MSFEIMASGNLAVDPIERSERGIAFISLTICSNVNSNEGQQQEWIDCTITGPMMIRAAKLKKRDGIHVRGAVTKRYYTHGNEERQAWQMDVNHMITDRETYTA